MTLVFRLVVATPGTVPAGDDFELRAERFATMVEAVDAAGRCLGSETSPYLMCDDVVFHPHHIRVLLTTLSDIHAERSLSCRHEDVPPRETGGAFDGEDPAH